MLLNLKTGFHCASSAGMKKVQLQNYVTTPTTLKMCPLSFFVSFSFLRKLLSFTVDNAHLKERWDGKERRNKKVTFFRTAAAAAAAAAAPRKRRENKTEQKKKQNKLSQG